MKKWQAVLIFICSLLPLLNGVLIIIGLTVSSVFPDASEKIINFGLDQIKLMTSIIAIGFILPLVMEAIPNNEKINWLIIHFFFNGFSIPCFCYKYLLKPAFAQEEKKRGDEINGPI